MTQDEVAKLRPAQEIHCDVQAATQQAVWMRTAFNRMQLIGLPAALSAGCMSACTTAGIIPVYMVSGLTISLASLHGMSKSVT